MNRWQSLPRPRTVLALFPLGETWLVGSTEGLWRVRGDHVQRVNEALANVAISAVAAGARRWLIGAADGIAWSDDEGQTWIAAALEAPAHVTHIALSPHFDADGMALAATMNRGVLRTRDGGQTWQACNVGIPDDEVTAIAIAPSIPTLALAATPSGWFFTEDFGRAWVQLGETQDANPIIGIALARTVQVFAHERGGLRYSQNMGRTLFARAEFSGGDIRRWRWRRAVLGLLWQRQAWLLSRATSVSTGRACAAKPHRASSPWRLTMQGCCCAARSAMGCGDTRAPKKMCELRFAKRLRVLPACFTRRARCR